MKLAKYLTLVGSIVIYVLRCMAVVTINLLVYLYWLLYLMMFYLIRFWLKVTTPCWTKSNYDSEEASKLPFIPGSR